MSEDNIVRLSGGPSLRTVIALGKVTQYHLLQDNTPFQYLNTNVNQVHTGPFGPFRSVNLFIYTMYADSEHNTEDLQYLIKPHTIIYCETSQIVNTCMEILTWQRWRQRLGGYLSAPIIRIGVLQQWWRGDYISAHILQIGG